MKKFLISLCALFVLIFVIVIGPWPVDNEHFQNSVYKVQTFSTIKKIKPNTISDELYAGVAKINITPPLGVPMSGYSAREPKANVGILDRVFAKAITINNGQNQITLLSAEILLPLPELIGNVLRKTGLNRNQLYFASTHTHSGPGGYAHGLVESFSVGDFDATYFDFLVDQLAQVVLESQNTFHKVSLKYARFGFQESKQQEYIHNQLTDGKNAHDSTHVLQLLTDEFKKPIATLLTFSAHPTFLGRKNRKISGDYPGVLMRKLEQAIPGEILFITGAVGGMLPVGENRKPASEVGTQIKQMHDLGERLANNIIAALNNNNNESDFDPLLTKYWQSNRGIIHSETIPITLPNSNYRITDSLRISPLILNMAFHNRETYIHVLRIGKLIFFAYPADFSGELAIMLETWGNSRGVFPIIHSFNGDYIGYLTPSYRYNINHSITRDTNFYGRWAGDYFVALSQEIIKQLYN